MISANARLRLTQSLLILLFLGLGLFHSLNAPFAEGPDEAAHFLFSRFWAKYGYLPLTPAERAEAGYKSDWPPMFHALVGLAGRGIDLESPPFVKIAQNNPRLQLVVGHENVIAWRVLTTEDPLRGEMLLWYLGRWATLLCGLAGVVAGYRLAQAVYPGQPWLNLGITALLAFLPVYLTISSIISYEPLLGFFLALYFMTWFFILRQPERNSLYLVVGGFMGLAGLTKYTPLTAAPLLPLFVIWLAYRRRWSWSITFWRLSLIGLGLLFTFGIWFFYMAYHLNRVAELGWLNGLIHPFLVSDGSDATSLRLAGLITGQGSRGGPEFNDNFLTWFWRLTNWGMGWFTGILWGLWALALVGLIRRWPIMEERARFWVILLSGHIIFFTILLLLRFVLSRQAATGMGQHFLFPAGAATLLLMVEGLRSWLKPAPLVKLLWLAAIVALWQSAIVIAADDQDPWPVWTVPREAEAQALRTFGEMALLGYTYQAGPQSLGVSLEWRAEALINEDYEVELSLTDARGELQRRWIGQPLNGRYPTRAWAVGDRLRDQLYLPVAGLPAGTYQLQLRVLKESSPLSWDQGETFALAPITLTPATPPPAPVLWLDEQKIEYLLWEKGQPVSEAPLYRENGTVLLTLNAGPGDRLPETLQVKLVGPDGEARPPLEQIGQFYSFRVKPQFVSGAYRLRVEQWEGEQLVAQVESPELLQVKTEERQFTLQAPVSEPLLANFAGYITLLGYDLPQRQVQPGGQIPLTLHWQALKTIGGDLIMFSRLVDEKQQVWGGRDRLIREVYSTILWAPEEIVTDPLAVAVDPAAPPGIYYLMIGLYLPVGQSSVSVPLLQDGQLSEVTSVRLGPIKVGPTPPGLTVDNAQPQVSLSQPFGQPPRLALLGYDLNRQAAGVKLKLYWQAQALLDKDYTTFVHLRNAEGETVLQQDQPPLQGIYPTSLWSPGETVVDEISLPAPAGLPAGRYQIVVGLYDFNTGQRLPTGGAGNGELILADFAVES